MVENMWFNWELSFNLFTITTTFIIVFVATHIQVYSACYINNDINGSKFLGYLSLFVFFMLVGVLGNNLIQLLIGWEGVGIMSYLLINFYDTRTEASKSSIKALWVNKVGDMGLLLGILTA